MAENIEKMKIGELSDESFEYKEVKWKIPASKIRLNFLDYDLQSPPFSFAGANWILHLYPYGCTDSASVGCIKLEIERLDSKIADHCIQYKSYFITHQRKEFQPIRVTCSFNSNRKSGWLLHISKENFFLDEKIIITKESLALKCQMRTKKINETEVFSPSEIAGQFTGFSHSVSRQNSSQLKSENEGIAEFLPTQESLLSESESKDSIEENSDQPLMRSVSTCTESSDEIPRGELESFASSSKGCDCTPSHPKSLFESKMLQDFKELYLNQEDCDVIMNVKGQEFLAHKNIIRARSPVLASTFGIDMKEKETGVVDIEDCDPSSFSDFLCFIYCGNAENITTENVFSLFTTADKYDVKDLRSACLEFLKKNLSVDTFVDTVILALQHLEKELIELTGDFFAKNLKEIIVTVKWQSFIVENPIRSNEIMIKALVHNKN